MAQDTEVGSYFVSNYPPYSFWKPEFTDSAHHVLQQSPTNDAPVGIYMHIPFCRKRCKFCYFRVYTDKNNKERELYVEALKKELELYQQLPIQQQRISEFFYVGGGTPSALNEKLILSLGEKLKELFPKTPREVTFECEPGTLTMKKLQAIKEFGTTRLSLGIENYDDHVLSENGRAHLSEEIYKAYDWARDADFPQINIDLIAGMVGETEENWHDCIEKVIKMAPESVTIYQMELPFNTVYARSMLESDHKSPVADWPTKRKWAQYAFEQLKQSGYRQSSAYTMIKEEITRGFIYRDSLWYGADMIGTGVASFSHVQGIHYQNLDHFNPYMEAIHNNKLPIVRAFRTSLRHRLIREMILQLKLGKIAKKGFYDKFQIDVIEEFGDGFRHLEQRGMLSFNEDTVTLTPDGLLRVDSLLPTFYEQEHQNARYT